MGAIAICVRFNLGTPVIFRQPRAGRNGQPFTLHKFRTMTDERDAAGNLLPPVERLTSFGRFLRSTSMDELPQLWNVVRGDMSLVGPRPLLLDYLPLYTPEQARRHQVRPGVTGWAQVKGRNALTWEEKFALDVWYVDHLGLVLDLKILLLTLERIVRRDDVNTRNGALMPRFMGSQPAELLEGEIGEG
jgi:lipopolysaccharide/colanic/teichoic acid biosynthesis glycosyltransferase